MAKEQRRDPKREALWREVLARFGKSGLSVRSFCARERLSEPSFYAWRRVINQRDAKRQLRSRRPTFVPVLVQDQPRHDGDSGISIELCGGRVLRLPRTMPVQQIAELARAIEAAPKTPETQP